MQIPTSSFHLEVPIPPKGIGASCEESLTPLEFLPILFPFLPSVSVCRPRLRHLFPPRVTLVDRDLDSSLMSENQNSMVTDARGTASVSQVLECMNSSQTSVRRGALSLTHLAISPIPLSIPLPFPMIFGPNVGRRGDILPDNVSQTAGRGGLDIVSSSVAARVSTGESMLPYVKERSTNFCNLGVSRSSVGSHILEEWGFAKEEAHDLGESLGDLVSAYGERRGDEGSSDSD